MQTETMIYTNDAVFFCDTLIYNTPYISGKPRNHDSFAFVTDGTLGYENQGKFARVFAETYGAAPLEFRRLSK